MFTNRMSNINRNLSNSFSKLYKVSADALKQKTQFISNINNLSIESKNISNKLEYISLKFQKLAMQNGGAYTGNIGDEETSLKIYNYFIDKKYLDFDGKGIPFSSDNDDFYWYRFTGYGVEGNYCFLNDPKNVFGLNNIMSLSNSFSINDKELGSYLKDFTSRISMDHDLLNQLLGNLQQIFNNQLSFDKQILNDNI